MVTQSNILDNQNINVISQMGAFTVLEHKKDLSVPFFRSDREFFASEMNIRKRQVMIALNGDKYRLQAGAMQWMSSDVSMSSGITGIGNFIGKMVSAKVTGETAAKPVYSGTGTVMLEPTYKYILLIDVSEWGTIVLDDGLFLACEDTLQQKVVARGNLSSAVLGAEGLFNLSLSGKGILACESNVPMDELIEVRLENDTIKIDGNMAVAWSGSLDFSVEKSGKSLLGSAVSGEGLVNVYRGTGRILLSPTAREAKGSTPQDSDSNKKKPKKVNADTMFDVIDDVFDLAGDVLDIFS